MKRLVDKGILYSMFLGVAIMLNPWWNQGLRWGFFITAISTIGHIIFSHWEIND